VVASARERTLPEQKYEEEKRRFEEEVHRREREEHAREQERAHWGCAFFTHCWNEGLKLPTLNNCPKCSDKYTEYRQDTVNRRSVHERIGRIHPSDGRRIKINEVDYHPRKRYADHKWVDHEEQEREYVWQEGQWVPIWPEEKPKEKSSALEKSGVEASKDQEETCVASKR
jgi:hypothetical protein